MTQDNGKPEDEDADTGDAPEVEAEVVGAAEKRSATAFDNPAFADDEPASGGDEGAAPKKSTLTPGVLLFFGFVAVALSAFAVWWFVGRDPGATISDPMETAAPERGADGAPASPEETAEGTTPALPDPGPKVEHTREAVSPPPALEAAPDDTFLPPVTDRDAAKIANTIEAGPPDADEEGPRQRPEGESAPVTADDPESQQTEETPGFDIDGAGEDDAGEAGASAAGESGAHESDTGTGDERAPAPAESEDPVQEDVPDAQSASAGENETATGDNGLVASNAAREASGADDPPQMAGVPQKIVNDIDVLQRETGRLHAALSAEQERSAGLAADIADLQRSFERALAERDARYGAAIADMRASLEKIESNEIEGASDKLKATLALAALRRQIDLGEPFAEELTATAQFAPERAAALTPYAHEGVPTEAALREQFGPAARDALAAAGQEAAGGGVSGVLARARSLVSVRPAAPQSGDGPRAVVSRAEQAVEEGDLTGALREIENLPPGARAAMAGWITMAEARAQAQSALDTLAAQFNRGSE
ncbi:mitofilin family membrane protein [Hyphococcus sp.]|uniref:COG4223 family protein n=1 Tax=Hyphococcus sp. TaxID=2038636 RepID=UPI003CCC32E9